MSFLSFNHNGASRDGLSIKLKTNFTLRIWAGITTGQRLDFQSVFKPASDACLQQQNHSLPLI